MNVNFNEVKSILDFMDIPYDRKTNTYHVCMGKDEHDINKIVDSFCGLKFMKFHTSWDWIMEVIDKIEKIGETPKFYGTLVKITTTFVTIDEIAVDRKLKCYEHLTKIEAVYTAVILFLKTLKN